AQRRLLEEERHVTACQRGGGRRLGAQPPVGLHLARQLEQLLERPVIEIEDGEKVFGLGGRRRDGVHHVRYSPLIFTYSAVRSHVQTVASPPPPVPRSTSIDTSFCFRCSAALGALSSWGRPFSNSRMPPTRTVARSTSNITPDRPAAATMRPQLGSAPCTAVFTSGELAMVLATRMASAAVRASLTAIVISLVAPSPPRTMPMARSRDTT